MSFTPDEKRAIAYVLTKYAEGMGEDVIGMFLKTGAFHFLPKDGVAALARKIEFWFASAQSVKLNEKLRQALGLGDP